MIDIRLVLKSEIATIAPLLKVLDSSLDDVELHRRLQSMTTDHGYECVGVYDGDRLIGISGLWILTKYYVGKHIEVDNVVVDPAYRDRGIGDRLMEWIYAYGRSKGCEAVELNCYVQNAAGNRFWKRQGFRVIGFHYQKSLNSVSCDMTNIEADDGRADHL